MAKWHLNFSPMLIEI